MTAQIVAEYKLARFDSSKFLSQIEILLSKLLEDASRAFVLKTYGRVPVHTGMARASIRPLANYLNVTIPIRPKVPRIFGKAYTKDVSAGYAAGGFEFRYGPTIYMMIFQSRVFHYVLNEALNTRGMSIRLKNLTHNTPWQSNQVGMLAFLHAVRTGWNNKNMPLPQFFIKRIIRIK